MRLSQNLVIITLLFSSTIALCFAYISQYFFGLEPCILCLYQRLPFFFIVFLCATSLTFFKKKSLKKSVIFLSIFFLAINVCIAFYHIGVEKKIFLGTDSCVASENISSIEELQTVLMSKKIARCDEPSFVFLGLSMAGWNFIYCITLMLIVLFAGAYKSSPNTL
jgi:disulfide bond formation protein DsbB